MTDRWIDQKSRYDSLFKYYGSEKGIDWRLLKCQAMAESALKPEAESLVGAKGLTQFMDPTWGDFEEYEGRTMNVWNPEHSIKAQAWYMSRLFKMFHETRAALAAYNWGMGNVRKVQQTYGDAWLTHAPEETQNYVSRIEGLMLEIDR